MLQHSVLQRLYPNLKIPSQPTVKPTEKAPPAPKPTPKPEPPPVRSLSIERTPKHARSVTPKKVTIESPKKAEPEAKLAPPPREPSPKKVVPVQKPAVIPVPDEIPKGRAKGRLRDQQKELIGSPKGRKVGKNKAFTEDQRKEYFMKRLQRMSINRAEQEVKAVEQVLERNSHDRAKLEQEERLVRKTLSLINTAKYFAGHPEQSEASLRQKPTPSNITNETVDNSTNNDTKAESNGESDSESE